MQETFRGAAFGGQWRHGGSAELTGGYAASTGALTDVHEIRNAQVVAPTRLTPSVAQTAGGHERGEPLTWTAVVSNEGPNPTQREQVRATTGQQSLSNVSWTCEAAGGAECATAAGTGLPSPEAGTMPQGSSLTYKITGTPTPSTDYAQMTIESEPRGDTGELDPEISYSYMWQRCEVSGASCADIAGAEASAYHTTGADLGHTIHFTETATNSAGSTTVDSAVYNRLPTVEITSSLARYVTSGGLSDPEPASVQWTFGAPPSPPPRPEEGTPAPERTPAPESTQPNAGTTALAGPVDTTTPNKAHAPATHTPAARRGASHVVRRRTHRAGTNPVIRPFRPHSFALTRRARRLVRRLAIKLAHARRIVCVGYTDSLGARSANLALGLERARAVCKKLRTLGVHAVLKVKSRGEEHPCASNATAKGRALNRRVELRIVGRPQ